MLELGKVQSRGQVTVPRGVRKKVGIKPGDTLTFEVVGPDEVKVRVIPRRSISELWKNAVPVDGMLDWNKLREEAEAEAADELIRKMRGY
jgi:AbrB family looped-hinge helix DNA binding protein